MAVILVRQDQSRLDMGGGEQLGIWMRAGHQRRLQPRLCLGDGAQFARGAQPFFDDAI
jgi:hypothetical protein